MTPHQRIPKEWISAREPSRGYQSEGSSIKVLNLERGVVSVLLLGAILEVLTQKGGRVHRGTGSPRLVWHIEGQTLCHRIVNQGYYWQTMKQEFEAFVRKCDVSQRFGNVIHVPAKTLHSVTSLWPFYKSGIDVMGPFLMATGQRKFMLVATDYFTK